MDINAYAANHKVIRPSVMTARYPNITKARTTVDFIIAGRSHNLVSAPIGMYMLVRKSTDAKDFIHKYNEFHTFSTPGNQSISSSQAYGTATITKVTLTKLLKQVRVLHQERLPQNRRFASRQRHVRIGF